MPQLFVDPACSERDIVVKISGRCYVPPSVQIVQAITCTFVQGFQNNLAQLLTMRNRSAI